MILDWELGRMPQRQESVRQTLDSMCQELDSMHQNQMFQNQKLPYQKNQMLPYQKMQHQISRNQKRQNLCQIDPHP